MAVPLPIIRRFLDLFLQLEKISLFAAVFGPWTQSNRFAREKLVLRQA
jgi:hypothetical protein